MAKETSVSSTKIVEVINRITPGFIQFEKSGAVSGVLLIILAVIAMVWANSPWRDTYFEIWNTKLLLEFGEGVKINKPLLIWINDGLMAIFFFYIGLEIKQEIKVGELSTPRQVVFPLIAALGGMFVPAGLFALLHWGQPGMEGWGVPMATDIAFSLGILMLIGSRVPTSFKVFLTAFAIVDDIGAVLVIALFYSHGSDFAYLGLAAAAYSLMWIVKYANVRATLVFLGIGIVMWYFTLKSGVHPTVAGILAALAIPTNIRLRVTEFVERTRSALKDIYDEKENAKKQFLSAPQLHAISRVELKAHQVQPPLQKLMRYLGPWVSFAIMPIFALANAGVNLQSEGEVLGALTLHVFLGLVAGKVIGIMGFCWLGVKMGLASLPDHSNWTHLLGLSLLGGIGFTMSLFIASLAFQDITLLNQAKLGVLMGSTVAGISGYLVLRYSLAPKNPEEKLAE